jgi:uncharacterized membrane protein
MRPIRDRIRHALLLELTALAIVIPFGGVLFGVPPEHFGVVAIGGSLAAVVWTYVFNLLYDRAALRLTGSVRKTLRQRVLHAVLFEAGLTGIMVPPVAWYLGISYWESFLIDFSLVMFYLVFAFAYNWLYDIVFPLPETAKQAL